MYGGQISRIDVIDVARELNKVLTEDEIDWILENYPSYQEEDPTGTWNLVVENMIYFILEHPHVAYGEDASTDDCWFDYEN